MRDTSNIENCRFGRLTAIKQVGNDKYNHIQWLCKCDCGKEKVVLLNSLTSGRTRSCGCYYKDTRKTSARTHGQTYTKLFHTWAGMLGRCRDSNRKDYLYYGGKGVKVCEEWNSFENFCEWAINNGYSENLTIDRIDGKLGYSPSNCRWVGWITQMNNTTRNRFIELNGEKHTLSEWSRLRGIPKSTIYYRLNKGYSEQEAITLPIKGERA